jgi:hypothetical protein
MEPMGVIIMMLLTRHFMDVLSAVKLSDVRAKSVQQQTSTWSMPATSAKLVPAFFTISMRAVPNSLQVPGCQFAIKS